MKMHGLILLGHPHDAPPTIEAFCPQCHETLGRTPAMGKNRYVDTCRSCGLEHYGGAPRTPVGPACVRCNGVSLARRRMQPVERIPANGVCERCKTFNAELARLAKEQNAIGVLCEACRAQLIMEGNASFARAVRERMPEAHGKPVVVTIGKHQCPYCQAPAVEGGCRYRTHDSLDADFCNDPAEWTAHVPGRHEMPLCETHVRRFQEDPEQSGDVRIGRARPDGQRYVIARISSIGNQTKGGDQADQQQSEESQE